MINEEEAIKILRKHIPSDEVFGKILAHVQKVKEIALRIGKKVPGADLELIRIGSLLHDIGRYKSGLGKEGIKHGIYGAEIIRKEGLPEAVALIAERHIGAGITKKEILEKKLPLQPKDYVPVSKEEKIIAHADNLVFGHEERPFSAVVERYSKELPGKVKDFIALKDEVEAWMKNSGRS
ncbi:HD domain-containing protein [Candidatus Woesearchaeota archaeon]|nr:HD domain-containing protein [Candidatus Woesearchaeota archaeon]